MGTIFASDHALKGIAPNVGKWAERDLKPRASVPAIGIDLQNADTMTFRRLSDTDLDFELHAAQCYLPFCDLCGRPNLDLMPDTAHHHFGVEKTVDSITNQLGGGEYDEGYVSIRLERYEDDAPGAPVTGETRIYLSITGHEGIELTLDTAMRVSQVLADQVHVGRAARHLHNTNEVDPAELQASDDAFHVRHLAAVAAEEAEKAAKTAAAQARIDAVKYRWFDRPSMNFGTWLGMTRAARWFPRLSQYIGYGRLRVPVLHEIRLGFHLGLVRAERLTEKEREFLAKVVADYDAENGDGR